MDSDHKLLFHYRPHYPNSNLSQPWFYGKSRNILDDYSGIPEAQTNVLFLGCLDMRLALQTASCRSANFETLNIHLNDNDSNSGAVNARNILLTHIFTAEDFDPENDKDLLYLWDVWYSFMWNEETAKRFFKDIDLLLAHQLPISVNISKEDLSKLETIWTRWKTTASNMSTSTISTIIKQRELSIAEEWDNHKKSRGDGGNTLLPLDQIIWEGKGGVGETLAPHIYNRFEPTDRHADQLKSSIMLEIWTSFKTGNCSSLVGKTVSVNPTLLTFATNKYTIQPLACPFEGYVPVPFKQLKSTRHNGGVLLSYCQDVLKNLLLQLRSVKKTTFFHFHLGDSMQLCFSNELKNRFHVVECSNLSDHLGLANLLPIARRCLIEDPEAIILTDSMGWQMLKPTVPEFVETMLCCPLTVIPTLYGLRLANHVRLGRFSPVKILREEPEAITLTWKNVPTFSTDIKLNLELSSSLKHAFTLLKKICFLENDDDFVSGNMGPLNRHTPLTYYYIVQSLLSRASWNAEAIQFFLEPAIAKPFSLFWKTINDWMNGEELLHYQLTCPYSSISKPLPMEIDSLPLRLLVVPQSVTQKYLNVQADTLKRAYMTGNRNQTSLEAFIKGARFIDNFNVSMTRTADGKPGDVSISFLLTKDHGISELDAVFPVSVKGGYAPFTGPLILLKSYKKTTAQSFFSDEFHSRLSLNEPTSVVATTQGLNVLKCVELQNGYELSISVQGLDIQNIKELDISTDRIPPSESCHKLTLKLKNHATPLTIQFPWPFLVNDIKSTLYRRKPATENNSTVMITLKKSINDPWPDEFSNRRVKWNVDLLKPWVEDDDIINTAIMSHVMAQSNISSYERHLWISKALDRSKLLINKGKPATPLDEVRDIIRDIFNASNRKVVSVFSITDKRRADETPDFIIKVHQPFRTSPLGAPLLVATVVDRRLAEELVVNGKLDQAEQNAHCRRIIQDGKPSADGVVAHTYTDEGKALFRYMLRLNSTKMQPTDWHKKNLPKSECWMATFISPLYVYYAIDCVGAAISSVPSLGCGHCKSVKPDMKRCIRCKKVLYCDAQCQKADWLSHKMTCSV